MARNVVKKSIAIQAPTENIWQVITDAERNVEWLEAFGAGNVALTDWREGSRAIFKDDSGSGLIAIIRESTPFQKIRIQNIGIITDGKEDCESAEAVESREFFEQYILTNDGEQSIMHVKVNVEDDFFEKMSACWEDALNIIKKQAERLHHTPGFS